MLRVDSGVLGRRDFLQLGAAGLGAFAMPSLLRAREGRAGKDTRVILLWLEGGPSHMDLWDMKPEAPPEYRGFWRPIATNAPGVQVSETLPRMARVADKFSIIRTLHHDDPDHIGSPHILLTGRPGPTIQQPAAKAPSLGSIAARMAGARRPGLPGYVVVPRGGPYHGAQYVGRAFDPFETGGDPNRKEFRIQNLTLPGGLTLERIEERRALRRGLDMLRRDVDKAGMFEAMDKFEQQAYELLSSPALARAFDLNAEDEKLRNLYGRNTWGQATLLARRLVEAGVTFATVNMGGWDQHWNLKPVMNDYLPKLDALVSALFQDLASRGLLEKVLVIVTGEFSRTPRMNDGSGQGTPGRDHWNNAISLLAGGGGVKGGRVVGKTDARGEYIVERPVTPEELHATIYHVLGVDPSISFVNTAGRPVPILDGASPIRELL